MPERLEPSQLTIAEYQSLRAEALTRIEQRAQRLLFALVATGVLAGIGLQDDEARFVLALGPLPIFFLALSWVSSALRLERVARYIRERIEKPFPDLIGWESDDHFGAKSSLNLDRWSRILVDSSGQLIFMTSSWLLISLF